MSIPLAALEEIIDASGIAPRIELLLPTGVRRRQLAVRTLLAGMMLSQADHRPAHLTRVQEVLVTLPEDEQPRLGVVADWKTRPAPADLPADRADLRPGRRRPGQGHPRRPAIADPRVDLRRPAGGIHPAELNGASTSLAVDWTDVETFSRPPPRGTSDCADPEASWGHRSGGGPGQDSELFFGYYGSAATMMREEHGPPVPELARRMTVSLLPSRPGPRPGPGAHRDAGHGIPPRRHPGRLRLRPPRRRRLGHPAARRRGATGPGPAPPRPRPPGHPPRRHHRQRQPLLPGHPHHPAETHTPGPRRHPRAGQRA